MRAGLVSVTFRQLKAPAVLQLMKRAGLCCVEWGGDAHVPAGAPGAAALVRRQTGDAGVSISAYGSYYRLDTSEQEGLPFEIVLETAIILGAPAIRVWTGRRGRLAAEPGHYIKAAEDALRIADLAAGAGKKIIYEYHGGTFTDAPGRARDFMRLTSHPAIQTLWQPPNGKSPGYCMDSLDEVLPLLHHVHVFHWWPDASNRLPLSHGGSRWRLYLEKIRKHRPQCDLLLEFVADDSPAQLLQDAACLNRWLAGPGPRREAAGDRAQTRPAP
jgi:sugar phosphate isomerase/epimerase